MSPMLQGTHNASRKRWLILAVTYLSVLSLGVMTHSIAPILTFISGELSLSHTQAGLLMSFFAIPGIVAAIPAGILADRINQRTLGIISFALLTIGGTIFATGHSFVALGLGRLISGLGAITLYVMAAQSLSRWFAGKEIGIAMGVFNTAFPSSTILSLNLLSSVAERSGWRVSVWITIGLAAAVLIIFSTLYSAAPGAKPLSKGKPGTLVGSLRDMGPGIWFVGFAWMLFTAALFAFFTFTPDFLHTRELSVGLAGFMTSLVPMPALIMSPLVGHFVDHHGYKCGLVALGAGTLSVLFFLIPMTVGIVLPWMLAIGFAQVLVPTAIFTLAPEMVKPERIGLSFGVVVTCMNAGILTGPALAGFVRDTTGSYQASYALMAGLALLVLPVIGWLALNKRRIVCRNDEERCQV